MEQERVSFKIAKAIKAAGYDEICEYGYCVTDSIPNLVKTEEEWERHAINNSDMHDYLVCTCQEIDGKDDCTAPTYINLWLWLWREKGLRIREEINVITIYDNSELGYVARLNNPANDPEEAIIAAIEYLVDNNLIK